MEPGFWGLDVSSSPRVETTKNVLRHFTTWPWEDKITPRLRTDGVLYGLGYKDKEKN